MSSRSVNGKSDSDHGSLHKEFPRLDRLRRLGKACSDVVDAWRPVIREIVRIVAIGAASGGLPLAIELAHRATS